MLSLKGLALSEFKMAGCLFIESFFVLQWLFKVDNNEY